MTVKSHARRLLLRIEPAGAEWAGTELPLPPGAERIISAAAPMPEAGADASPSLGAAGAGIDSPMNRCCHRDACRALLSALRDILANPRYDLLPLERHLAERAVALAEGREQ